MRQVARVRDRVIGERDATVAGFRLDAADGGSAGNGRVSFDRSAAPVGREMTWEIGNFRSSSEFPHVTLTKITAEGGIIIEYRTMR